MDGSGNIYLADHNNQRVRKITAATGYMSTYAGTGTSGYIGDTTTAIVGVTANLNATQGVALDSAGNLYITEMYNHRIRKVTTAGIITTVAGTGASGFSGDGGSATSAQMNTPGALALDSAGNLYIAENSGNRVRKVTVATGIITTLAGTGTAGYVGGQDGGPATNAQLNNPSALAFDSAGNLYITDNGNHRIRKVTAIGGVITSTNGCVITTFAGTGSASFSGDTGAATSAQLSSPYTAVFDSAGNMYISDSGNQRIRKITGGTITTVVGNNGTGSFSGDGSAATNATLNNPTGLALDSAGNLYITDTGNRRVRKVTAIGGAITSTNGCNITTVVGNGTLSYSGDGGPATNATMNYPVALALDSAGNLYIGDQNNHRVRKVDTAGNIFTVAGTGSTSYNGDSYSSLTATTAQVSNPIGVAVNSAGILYIAERANHRIRQVDTSGNISTVAGNGTAGQGGDGGPAVYANLYNPESVILDASGNLYIADYTYSRTRKVTAINGVITATNGAVITTVTGTGTAGYNGDSVGTTGAKLGRPWGVVADPSGNVYYSEYTGHVVRKIDTSNNILPIVGTGSSGYSTTLAATNANVIGPPGVVVDASGNIYFTDSTNHRVRKVNAANGNITTVAGTGTSGYTASHDGGRATSATLNSPNGLALDAAGNLYIAEYSNYRVRKVNTAGTITTVAGTGTSAYSGDGLLAISAGMVNPRGLAVDLSGNLYISDYGNQRVRKVAAATGFISTVAGTGSGGFTGDTLLYATNAQIYSVQGIAVDSASNIYFTDYSGRFRKVTAAGIISTVAGSIGSASYTYSGDGGSAINAGFNQPYGVVFDSAGNIYIADYSNSRVRKITVATGIITTVVGTGTGGFAGDAGQATSAQINNPTGLAFDSAGNLYIADYNNHRIRKVNTSGIITTVAGLAGFGYTAAHDGGAATSATLNNPRGVVADAAGNIYIADTGNNRIRKVAVGTGIITSVTASVNTPYAIVIDTLGILCVADYGNNRVIKVTSDGTVTTVAGGTGNTAYNGDGITATSANLWIPNMVALDSAGNIYITDNNYRIRKVTVATGIITTVVGTGTQGFNGDSRTVATGTSLYSPWGLALDSSGSNLYIADRDNNRVRQVNLATGAIYTVAGTGNGGATGDGGAATSAAINLPSGVALDASGNLYIADYSNQRIRKVIASTGIMITVVGSGANGYAGDNGYALGAKLSNPQAVTLDASNNIYFAEGGNNRVRKVTASTGIVTTVAGNGTTTYVADPTMDAVSNAQLNGPGGLALDASNNLYITSSGDHRIRMVTNAPAAPNQLNITTIANINGGGGMTDGVPAATSTSSLLNNPFAVAVDSIGYVYVAETGNNRIRAFHP